MTLKLYRVSLSMIAAAMLLAAVFLIAQSSAGAAQGVAAQEYGIAVKRPVLQAACKYCPWGALGAALKNAMAPDGYDVAICHTCSGVESTRIVSKRLMPPEVSDRQFAEGTPFPPDAPIDFGITTSERVTWAYQGTNEYKKDGPITNLRHIARIESPAYLMIAASKSSGITDLNQVRERKMPIRIMTGTTGGLGNIDVVLRYFGMTRADITSWGGKILQGNALLLNPDFDLIVGVGVLANYPEGGMWYEMSQKKDLTFFPIPDELRKKLVAEYGAVLVDLPFRYLRGVGDAPIPTVGFSGTSVYGRDDLPDAFVRDVVRALDERHDLIKWTNQPFSYDPATVWDGKGVPLHPAAAAYYRERGYMK